jgi:hypothetical protein
MAGLDDLYAQIPTSEIANKLGADEGEVDTAIRTLVPALLSGLQQNSEDPEHADKIETIASGHAEGGESDGHQAVATLFGGSDADQVASALAQGGAGNSDLLKKLLPVLIPIVLAYIGNQLKSGGGATKKEEASGGILGNVLSGKGGALGDILGGLLGGKK